MGAVSGFVVLVHISNSRAECLVLGIINSKHYSTYITLPSVSRALARHPAKFMRKSGFYDILIISLFYQNIIDIS